MSKLTPKIMCVILSIMLFGSQLLFSKMEATDLIAKYGKSVVMIYTLSDDNIFGLGSGFVVSNEGLIITNFHVLYNSEFVAVKSTDGTIYNNIKVVGYDPHKDLALIKVEAKNLIPLPLGDYYDLSIGESVVVIGNPFGLENSVSVGVVSQVRDMGEGYDLIQTDASISQGSSGGPLFNLDGKVMGVVTSSLQVGQNLNFAVPINYSKPFLKSQRELSITQFHTQTKGKYSQYESDTDTKSSPPADNTKDNKDKRNMQDTDALYKKGTVAIEDGDCNEAKIYFREIKSVDLHYEDALYDLGVCFGNKGDYDEAKHYLEKLYKKNPNHEFVKYSLGFVYIYINNEDKGIALLESFLKKANDKQKRKAKCALGIGYLHKAGYYAQREKPEKVRSYAKMAYDNIQDSLFEPESSCTYKERDLAEDYYHAAAKAEMYDLCKKTANGGHFPDYFIIYTSKNNAYSAGTGYSDKIEDLYETCNKADKMNCKPHTCVGVAPIYVKFIVSDGKKEYYGNGICNGAAFDAFQQCFKSNVYSVDKCYWKQIIPK